MYYKSKTCTVVDPERPLQISLNNWFDYFSALKVWKTIKKSRLAICPNCTSWVNSFSLLYFKPPCLLCHVLGQHCDCTEHDMPKDRIISQLRGELQRLQEQMRKSEVTKQPQKHVAKPSLPTIFVITPTYARWVMWHIFCSLIFTLFCSYLFK